MQGGATALPLGRRDTGERTQMLEAGRVGFALDRQFDGAQRALDTAGSFVIAVHPNARSRQLSAPRLPL